MPHCIAKHCHNSDRNNPWNARFHLLPTGKRRKYVRRQWLAKCARPEPNDSQAHVCSEHFKFPDDYSESVMKHKMGFINQPLLNEDAVPSVFLDGRSRSKKKLLETLLTPKSDNAPTATVSSPGQAATNSLDDAIEFETDPALLVPYMPEGPPEAHCKCCKHANPVSTNDMSVQSQTDMDQMIRAIAVDHTYSSNSKKDASASTEPQPSPVSSAAQSFNSPAEASTSHASSRLPVMIDSACQTDPPKHRTVRTQLSASTLRSSRRSTAVQTIDSSNFDVWTSNVLEAAPSFISTPTERPSKRRRVDPEEEEEEEDDGSFSVVASDGLDDTYDPAESVTNDTEKTDIGKEHIPYNIKTYIVYETCIMELFEMCPVCQRVCDVQTRRMGTFLSVEQLCPHCQFSRLWNSQPIVRSTPAGNLQLSTSVYVNGESFFKLEKVLKAINLQLFEYDTFLRHAKMFIEPAIVSNFKTSQEMMLRRLSEEDKIIPGGDLRADSPGHSERSGSTMDLKTNNVVDTPLFKSDEVGGSCQMEKDGLERGLALLQEHGCLGDLMALIFDENFVDPAPFKEEILKVTITEDLCAQDERPVKEEVIESFVTQVKTEAF